MKLSIYLSLSLFLVPSSFAVERPPNVLFILADDLGWSDTTLFGTTKFYQTPNIERLAKRGMIFTQAYSASPLCSPTRSAILTGLSPARTGITTPNCHDPNVVLEATTGRKAPPDQKSIQPTPPTRLKTNYPTLAKSLKAAGYATGHFGKWHLGSEPYSPLQQGFDVDVPHWPGPGPAGSFVAPWKFKDFDADPGEPNQHLEDRMAKEAVAFMEKHKDGPFYLNYWMFSVHAPFDAKKALIEKHRARVNPADPQRSPTYAAMIESMDDAVGTLLDTLDRLKIADNTIIIFTSDNGGNMYNTVDGTTPTSNAPLRGGKATMFEGGTRVPCVVVWPGVTTAGTRSSAIVQSEDYYPTLLGGLSIDPTAGQIFDGASILPALKGDSLEGKTVFQYFPHSPGVPDWLPPSVSVHRGDWKLIRIFHGGEKGAHRHLLFNLRDDVSEKTNLAAQKPELVAELDALIEKFLANTRAVAPVANPGFDPAKYHPEREGIQTNQDKPKPKPAPKINARDGRKAQAGSLGLTNGPNATVLKMGKPYRGIGINYFDCFLRTLKADNDTSYEAGFATLAAEGIPFARFCATGFWPRDMQLYQKDRAEYFLRLDGVVKSAEKHGVGLVPSLFWYFACVPDLVGEPMDQWGNPRSKTHAWMREYVREVVLRYRDSPAIWAWEMGNEYSLQANLPNAGDHRPKAHADLGTPATRSERDDLTFAMVRVAFAQFGKAVREHDPNRLVLTGDSFPRLSAWHQEHGNSWTHDTPAQFANMLALANPDPISGISLHAYEDDDQRFASAMDVSRKLGKPVFIGEFGAQGESPEQAAKFRRLLSAIEQHHIPLAAVWVFDLKSQKDFSVTADNSRSWQLKAIAEANGGN